MKMSMVEAKILVGYNVLANDCESMIVGFNTADSIQSHRSMILHILSQLRPGMDLTRVSSLWIEFYASILMSILLLGVTSNIYPWEEITSWNVCWPLLPSWPLLGHQWCSNAWSSDDSSSTVLPHYISCWKKCELFLPVIRKLCTHKYVTSLMWQKNHTIQYWVKCFVAMSMLLEHHQEYHWIRCQRYNHNGI